MIDLAQAQAHILALTGSADTEMEFRALHDKRKDVPGRPVRGTLAQCVGILNQYQDEGFGIFITVNETDGGRGNLSVVAIRAQFTDLDKDDAPARYQQAMAWDLAPSFAVISSPSRAHIYWTRSDGKSPEAVLGSEAIQRKLAVMFNGDPACVDPARVLRLAGSLNLKRDLPTVCTFIPCPGQPAAGGMFEWHLSGVVAPAGEAQRQVLGADPGQEAPSLEWATYALNKIDPMALDRSAWLKLTAAFKASAWPWGETIARLTWDLWCLGYGPDNDTGENDKLWRSINQTKTGWGYLSREANITAELAFAGKPVTGFTGTAVAIASSPGAIPVMPDGVPSATKFGWLLNATEQAAYFTGCLYVDQQGTILAPSGRLLSQGKFNGSYGGHAFVISEDGKTTDEPWKAATRGFIFRLDRVDHLRFLPKLGHRSILLDEFDRKGVNTYRPANIKLVKGDPSRFVNHLRRILPTERDLQILLNYLAHCVQRPGFKVPWAPVIQSTPGAGKGIIKMVMSHAVGSVYLYSPKAKELADSGNKFNAWMRSKLFILCDEIKVDDRRDMLEVLKPMISEDRVEIQSKGADQDMEDNPANWLFFTNWKDAIPIDKGERRYAIIYSPMQTVDDLTAAGMSNAYFAALYDWLRDADGAAICAEYLMSFPIDPELDPNLNQRAPATSSRDEAIVQSRGRIEQSIADAVEGFEPGFRGGWISSAALVRRLREEGMRNITPAVTKKALEGMGYKLAGRAGKAIIQEDMKQPNLWNIALHVRIADYERTQGYVI